MTAPLATISAASTGSAFHAFDAGRRSRKEAPYTCKDLRQGLSDIPCSGAVRLAPHERRLPPSSELFQDFCDFLKSEQTRVRKPQQQQSLFTQAAKIQIRACWLATGLVRDNRLNPLVVGVDEHSRSERCLRGARPDRSSEKNGVRLSACCACVGLLVILCGWLGGAPKAQAGATSSRFAHTRKPTHIIALHAVDGLSVARATHAIALRHFQALASDVSTVSGHGGCTLASKKLSLQMSYFLCANLIEVVVTGPGWQTPNGLRIGSTVRSLRRLFPHALNTRLRAKPVNGVPPGSIDWDLASVPRSGTYPVLVAYVKDQHVAAIGLEIAGH